MQNLRSIIGKNVCCISLHGGAAAVPENQYLADQIVRLTVACHGHALVLFTSYRQMRNVYDALGGRLTFPVFQAGRGQNRSIQQFKQSGNGVLFAAGSCWEGIDFPGDMVSLLIIAKLPFPIPDPSATMSASSTRTCATT